MSLQHLLLRRTLLAILTLLLVSAMIFSIVEVLPGDIAHRILGRDATKESLATVREQLHLNDPALIRYFRWLGGVIRGDFGKSLVSGRPVTQVLGPRVFNTFVLSCFALLIYVPLSLVTATIQAVRRDRPIDHFLSIVTLILLSIPDFLLGTVLLLAFVAWIPLFSATSVVGENTTFLPYLRALVLPGTTLAVVMAVYAVRMLRDNLIEVLESDYVRMAELKGLSLTQVVLRHALPNSIAPTLNVTALNLGYLIGGVMVVEQVYAFPGFGTLLVDAIRLLDVTVMEAAVLLASAIYISANLFVDIVAIMLNPRLRNRFVMTSVDSVKSGRGSRFRIYWRAWWRTPVTFRIGMMIVLIQLLVAATGPFWCPYPFDEIGAGIPLSGMSWGHPFGVDFLGRDVFSRVVYGAHIVILLSISGTILGLVVGSGLGLLSGYFGGWIDEVIQRVMEALVSIPFLVLGLLIVAAAGPTASGHAALVIFVIAFVYMPRVARMARAAALGIVTQDYVTVARLRGEPAWSVICRELLPNASSVLLVEFAIRAGYAPVLIAALGFLGFGLAPPTPEWGLIMSENRALIMTSPATVIGPGFMLAMLVVGLNLCTEGLARILGRTAQLAPK